jgi:ATP-dependent DNA ligase
MADAKLFSRLYSRTTNGAVQVWEIWNTDSSYFTVAGKLNGKMIQTKETIVSPKAGRDQEKQLSLVLQSKVKSKKDDNYVDNLEDIDSASDQKPAWEPMLASTYKKNKTKLDFPAIVQPKFDGVRCMIDVNGMAYRSRKEIESCQHIFEQLKPLFKIDKTLQLDGELFSYEFRNDFENIISLVKKTEKHVTEEQLSLQKSINFYVFDVRTIKGLGPESKYEDRWKKLIDLINEANIDFPNLKVTKNTIVKNVDELDEKLASNLEDGYEGVMVRYKDSPYEGKRSSYLWKYKVFQEKEFFIYGINEGSGNLIGCAGSFNCEGKNDDGVDVRFDARLIGKTSRLKYIWENQQKFIGKQITIKFQDYTVNGIPRFPVAKAIRDYE